MSCMCDLRQNLCSKSAPVKTIRVQLTTQAISLCSNEKITTVGLRRLWVPNVSNIICNNDHRPVVWLLQIKYSISSFQLSELQVI